MPSHTCTRCRITVSEDRLTLPDRCVDPACPLHEVADRIAALRAQDAARQEREGHAVH